MGEFGRPIQSNAAHLVNDTTAAVETRQTTLRYLPGLDGLRAISVIAVIWFHYYFLFGSKRGWAKGGFLGVEVFFVVSGYLITSLLLSERRETGRLSLKNFWLRRARRLLPALWLLLAVVIAYALLLLPDSIGTLKGDVVAALFYVSNWWQIAAHRSYAESAGRPELLKHLWSLAIEEQFYLFWPLCLMLLLGSLGRARAVVTMVATAVVSTILMAVIALSSINFAYYATFTRLSGLLLGSVMAFFFAPYRIRGLPGHGARIALDLAGAFGLFVLVLTFHYYTYPVLAGNRGSRTVFFGGFLLVDVATLLVIAAAVHPASDLGRLLGWRPLRYVGLRSYSLYLWHYPIFCVTRPRIDFGHFGHLHGWPVFVVRMALSFGAAELSYRYVESPIRHGALGRYRERLQTARGARKRRLARRGLVGAGALTLVAFMLGAGLASAQPRTEKFVGPTNGAAPDPSALAALGGVTTTTLDPTPTTHVTTAASTPGGHPTTTTVPHPKPPSARVLAIGDSVMLGAKSALMETIPNIVVDAAVSRQFFQAINVVAIYQQHGLIPPIVVIGLGTNGQVTDGLFDQMMNAIGPSHYVFFLTARVPRPWEKPTNDALHRGAQRWGAKVKVLEWRDYAGCHDDWFVPSDGFHLEPPGRHAYAQFILDGITGHPLTKCVK